MSWHPSWARTRSALAVVLVLVVTFIDVNGPVSASVQTLTGNYYYMARDIQIADSLHLKFERTYNSNDPLAGPLGPGWTHNLNVRLAHITNGAPDDLIFVGPMGRQDVYSALSDGPFQPSPTALGALVQNAADVSADLPAVAAPTLLVWGSRDALVPPSIGPRMHAQIPDARLIVLDGAGHVAQYDRPHPFNEAALAFLAEDQAGTYG